MPPFNGLLALAKRTAAEHKARKLALAFAMDFIEHKFRDGGCITKREYQEFLGELVKVK